MGDSENSGMQLPLVWALVLWICIDIRVARGGY